MCMQHANLLQLFPQTLKAGVCLWRRKHMCIWRHCNVVQASSIGETADLGGKARTAPCALGNASLDDLGFRNQDVHEITAGHEIEEEVEVVLVLEAGILADAEGVRRVPRDGLLAEHMLRALHHARLAHALHCIRPP